jgi:hypothetical protein
MKVNNFDGILWERIGDKATGFIFKMKFWFSMRSCHIDISHSDAEYAVATLREGELFSNGGAEVLWEEKQILNKLFKVLKENAKNSTNDESNKQTLGDVKRKRKGK